MAEGWIIIGAKMPVLKAAVTADTAVEAKGLAVAVHVLGGKGVRKLFTEVISSVEQVSRALGRRPSSDQLDDADELIAEHVAELHRRLRRIRARGVAVEVRLSPAVNALPTGVTAHQDVWG